MSDRTDQTEDGYDFFGLSILYTCPACGSAFPLDGPFLSPTCPECHSTVHIPEEGWQSWLNDVRESGLEPGQQTGYNQTGIYGELSLNYARTQPFCRACDTPIDGQSILGHDEDPVPCSACGEPLTSDPAPDWLKKRLPDVDHFFGIRADEESTSRPEAKPVAMTCPQCSGSLRITADTQRITTCEYCSTDIYLPAEIWARFHPKRTRQWWFVRFLSRSDATDSRDSDDEHDDSDADGGYEYGDDELDAEGLDDHLDVTASDRDLPGGGNESGGRHDGASRRSGARPRPWPKLLAMAALVAVAVAAGGWLYLRAASDARSETFATLESNTWFGFDERPFYLKFRTARHGDRTGQICWPSVPRIEPDRFRSCERLRVELSASGVSLENTTTGTRTVATLADSPLRLEGSHGSVTGDAAPGDAESWSASAQLPLHGYRPSRAALVETLTNARLEDGRVAYVFRMQDGHLVSDATFIVNEVTQGGFRVEVGDAGPVVLRPDPSVQATEAVRTMTLSPVSDRLKYWVGFIESPNRAKSVTLLVQREHASPEMMSRLSGRRFSGTLDEDPFTLTLNNDNERRGLTGELRVGDRRVAVRGTILDETLSLASERYRGSSGAQLSIEISGKPADETWQTWRGDAQRHRFSGGIRQSRGSDWSMTMLPKDTKRRPRKKNRRKR